jgi:hypothetical protein
MTTRQQVADAFQAGRAAKCHNAKTDGRSYWLHGHEIATRQPDGSVLFAWRGWYTPTTAAHMNSIIASLRNPIAKRVSYARHRDERITQFIV